MASSITYPSRLNLALELDNFYYSSDFYKVGDTISQIQTLATPPFKSSYYAVQGVLEDINYQARFGENETAYVYIYGGTCFATSEDSLSGNVGNCTEICADETTLFLPYNLDTCLTLSAVSMLVQHNNVTYVENHYEDERILGAGNLTDWDYSGVLTNIMACAVSACSQYNLSTCPQATQGLAHTSITPDNLQTIVSSLNDFCDNVGLRVNSDIAGPGVMISYLLQISVALFFWLLLKILTSWPRAVSWPFYLLLYFTQKKRRRPTVPGFDPNLSPPPYDKEPPLPGRRRSAWMRANDVQNRLIELRLHAATVSTLVEFQEVQAFFVGAIQVATLATFKPKGLSQSSDANSARSFGEAILDSQVVQALAINGMLPLLLVQCLLQHYGMRWWYTFSLLWATFVLALVVQARKSSLISSFDTLWEVFQKNSPLASCGNNANPMVCCDTNGTYWQATMAGVVIVYVAMALLTVDFLAPTLKRWQPIKAGLSCLAILEDQSRVYAWLRTKFWPPFLNLSWFVLEYTLMLLVIIYCVTLLEIATLMTSGSNTWGAWSFGQLVSVMVWVPLLFKFVYYNIL